MNPTRSPNPQPPPRDRAGRHRGRPVHELLARQTAPPPHLGPFNALPHHAAPAEEHAKVLDPPTAAATLGLDLNELDGLDVFAATSIVRRRARTAIDRLCRCRPRLRRARRATGLALDNPALTATVTDNILAVQIAETRLVGALDKLETTTERARAARRARALFYPNGGRLVISGPMHERLAQRQELADNTAEAIHAIVRRNLRLLLRQLAEAELFITTLDRHIDHALDHAAAAAAAMAGDAPPPMLRLLRAVLPAGHRHEWWREICSLFAEATPTERRAARLSLFLNAPRTIWTTWALARHHPARPTRTTSQTESLATPPTTPDTKPPNR